jgi:23S rRNA pseudouridine2604 synthase
MDQIRLNKFISESGYCSRREADKYIENGQVSINGKRAAVGQQVGPRDKVVVNGTVIERKIREEDIYIALNKPTGITCTTDQADPDNIVDYVSHPKRIFPIGRLDKDSQGLILLTSNGDIVNKILRAGNNHQKEYIVTVDKPITPEFLKKMANGVPILGEVTKKCTVEQVAPYVFRIVLIQGLNRQIRRMCGHFKYTVMKLERTRIMNIDLKGLPYGEWRELTDDEVRTMHSLLKDSSGEAAQKQASSKSQKPGGTKTGSPSQQKRTGNSRDQKPRSFGNKSRNGGKPDSRNSRGPSANRGKKTSSRGKR